MCTGTLLFFQYSGNVPSSNIVFKRNFSGKIFDLLHDCIIEIAQKTLSLLLCICTLFHKSITLRVEQQSVFFSDSRRRRRKHFGNQWCLHAINALKMHFLLNLVKMTLD